MLRYHGKQLLDKSVDNPFLLAQTVLGIMLICLGGGGERLLTKLIPISKLTSAFLFEQIEWTVQAISSVPADVKAIICNGIWVNQAFLNYIPHFLKNLCVLIMFIYWKIFAICDWQKKQN